MDGPSSSQGGMLSLLLCVGVGVDVGELWVTGPRCKNLEVERGAGGGPLLGVERPGGSVPCNDSRPARVTLLC
jgi:hypothetical protein